MSFLGSVLSFLPPLLIGIALVYLILPNHSESMIAIKLFWSVGVGLGACSLLFFLWCLIFSPDQPGYLILEIGILVILGYFFFRKLKCEFKGLSFALRGIHASWLLWTLGIIFLVLLVISGVVFVTYSRIYPHGPFDAHGIWNLHARFIARGGTDWKLAFSPLLDWRFHADYPLLIPTNVARSWIILHEETPYVPATQAALFTYALLGLLMSAIAVRRDLSQALLVGILLLATPMAIGTTQMADIPLAYYYLAFTTALYYYLQKAEKKYLALAGLMVGFAGWTKNDGLILIAACIVVYVLWLLVHKSPVSEIKKGLPWLVGIAVPMGAILYFKFFLAPANDFMVIQSQQSLLQRLFDSQRYFIIATWLWQSVLTRFGGWQVPIIPILILYRIIFRKRLGADQIRSNYLLGLLLVVSFIGYLVIYVITPQPLDWHLKYSLDRLVFHLYPSALFLLGLLTQTPEEIIPTPPYIPDQEK